MLKVGDEKAYTVNEAAELLNVAVQTVRNYINSDKIKAQKVGHAYYIAESNLQAFLKGESE